MIPRDAPPLVRFFDAVCTVIEGLVRIGLAVALTAAVIVLIALLSACALVTEGIGGREESSSTADLETVAADARCGVEIPCSGPLEGGSASGSEGPGSTAPETNDDGPGSSSGETTGTSGPGETGDGPVTYGPCVEGCETCAVDDGLCTVECESAYDCPEPPDGPPFCYAGVCLLSCPCPDGAECVEWDGALSCSWSPSEGSSSGDT